MRLGVLGPLLVLDEAGRRVPVAAARLRVLLAALLLHANAPVPTESLTELVWDGAPPGGAAVTLRTYVHRLRLGLGPAWARRIITHPPGYLCRADEREVDVLRFEALCRQADTAAGERRWERASRAAELAASLWRGTPLLDVPSRLLHEEFVPRLEQLHTQLSENQAEAALALGRHEQWIQPLRELVAAHPLRERFHAQLMLALHRSRRQAEALAVYRDVRRLLIAELGIEPGPELRGLHERILAGDADPAAPGPAQEPAPESASRTASPRQLPAAPGHFTGRRSELNLVAGLYGSPPQVRAPAGPVVICAVDGMAGIGKTALAVHAAHRLIDRFPDGQLFIDLHGHTRGYPPREPGQALEVLMRALGAPALTIPEDTEECAALYRQRLAGTRTLIVLDNALDEAQVRPLLPGAPGCAVLVTSRRRLKGLDDARSVSLGLLPEHDAIALLSAVAGVDRVPGEDPLPGEIAQLCGYLPLALRIAGALLRHRSAWTPRHLADLLRDQHRRVAALSDGERDLGAIFDLSYTSLDARQRLLFRRLALVPGPDADAYAAAALVETDPATATGLLGELVDHNLLTECAPGRFRLHDLLRAHARTLVVTDPGHEQALDRLLGCFVHTAHSASAFIARYPRPVPAGPVPAHAPVLHDPETARAWLRAEHDNLEAAAAHARAYALHEQAIGLAAGLAEILRNDGPFAQALDLHQAAADTAENQASPLAHATALTDLGIARLLTGDPTGAGDALNRALEIFRAIGNRHGEAGALAELGVVRRVNGDIEGAGDALNRALEIFRATGHRDAEANALTELGRVQQLLGNLAGAGDGLARALEIFRTSGRRHGEANALTLLGLVRRVNGDLEGAGDALRRALEIFRAIGHRHGEAYALTELGTVRRLAGDRTAAVDTHPRALEIFRAIGHRHGEAWALNHYAAALAAAGRGPEALALYRQALAIHHALNKLDDEAVSLEGIAEHHIASGDPTEAATHLRRALEIYLRLGMGADTRRIRHRLSGISVP